MPNYDPKIAAVIAEITAAFDGVSREDGITLHEAQAIDDYGSDAERAAAHTLDTETRWQDIPDEDIQCGYVVLSYLDPKGFRYYIPAYMVWVLRNLENNECESMTPDSVESSFVGYKSREQKARFALFTRQQSKAIAHFLKCWANHTEQFYVEHGMEYDREDNALNQALGYYWGQFL